MGRVLDVIVDEVDADGATCRTKADAPEIDGNLFIDDKEKFDVAGFEKTLKDLADNIHSKTICFFGASAAMPVQSFLQKFRGEFLARIEAATRGLPGPSSVGGAVPLAAPLGA